MTSSWAEPAVLYYARRVRAARRYTEQKSNVNAGARWPEHTRWPGACLQSMHNVGSGTRTFSAKNRKMLDTFRASLALSSS